jgi:thiol-disulfide isomerase/thioredoxin
VPQSSLAVRFEGNRDRYVAGWKAALDLVRGGRSWSGHERHCAFLNLGDGSFADVSAVTGLDFADDGRGLATVDWDQDGDLDLWITARTAPRLRLMTSSGANRSLALRLRGTTCNRDAIGARVTVSWADGPPSVQTARAGNGYLSQSSKWLHFGAGPDGGVESVFVRWPSGEPERFEGVEPGGRYLLVQGTGAAALQPARAPIEWTPREASPDADTAAARIPLPVRVPFPALQTEGELALGPGPVLVNLWATWCAPCVGELGAFTAQRARLSDAGVDVVSIVVDDALADADRILDELAFPFRRAVATPELLESLELLQQTLFHLNRPLVVPVSFLVDGQGRLAVMYRGTVAVEALLADVRALDEPPHPDDDLPFHGRRHGTPPAIDPWLSTALDTFGDTSPLLEAAIERNLELARSARERGRPTPGLERRTADLHYRLGSLHIVAGREEAAARSYREALRLDQEHARAHNDLGRVLLDRGRLEAAIEHFERALALEPELAPAQQNLRAARRRQRN